MGIDIKLSDFHDIAPPETVTIERALTRKDAEKPDPITVQMIIVGNANPQTILPTGEVIDAPPYEGYVESVTTKAIKKGDIVVRQGCPRLNIDGISDYPGTDIKILAMTQTVE